MTPSDARTNHGETATATIWSWTRRATFTGLAASLLVHLIMALLASVWTVRYSNADAGGSGADVVDFAVMSEAELAELTDESVQLTATHVPDLAAPNLSDLDIASETSSGEIDALTTELVDIDVSSGGGDISSSTPTDGTTGGGGLSGDGASFFGVEAQGNRFAYIVDISSSMRADGKMDRTKQELIRSISALAETSEVVVVLYSNGPIPLTGEMEWNKTTKTNKIRLRRQILDVEPGGSTRPLGAFELVFQMNPKPDAVYFMTDGQFDSDVPSAVRSLNTRPKVPVHCIMFGEIGNAQARSEVEDMMRTIARQSGGRFKHVGAGP
ncbi:MAG: VWA domain-containing protein [Planctomycetota bacterium]|nr:MAG: VWA domain-containing protein [Planctomycetota bacterium]